MCGIEKKRKKKDKNICFRIINIFDIKEENMKADNEIYDVIIIGCGSSGIAAGIEFEKLKSNINYLILEGRNRIGGRAFTDVETFGENIPIDLGAHYLCHHQQNNFLWNNYIKSDKDFIESDIYQKNIMKIFDQNGNIISDDLIDQSMKYVYLLKNIQMKMMIYQYLI
jgi:UDP-galactopyranose mutase